MRAVVVCVAAFAELVRVFGLKDIDIDKTKRSRLLNKYSEGVGAEVPSPIPGLVKG